MNNSKLFSKKNVQNAWEFFLDLIFPVECLGCGEEGHWVCVDCFHGIKLNNFQRCFNCKKNHDFGKFCISCKEEYYLAGIWIACYYDDELVNSLIKKFKYNFIKDLDYFLSKILFIFLSGLRNKERIINSNLKVFKNFEDLLIIPVPLHPKRLRFRGFNQSEEIALKLANYLDFKIDSEQLVRIKHNKPQAKLNESKRFENIKNCFAWRGDNLRGRNILLVDDVVTTGATLNEAARVLKENGAGQVWGLAVAKG
ncbi:MAG: ComF family protein [Patescibacteria group bacterium]